MNNVQKSSVISNPSKHAWQSPLQISRSPNPQLSASGQESIVKRQDVLAKPLVIGPIIDNMEDLKQIVMVYGKNVFKSKPVDDEILSFIVTNFVEKPFLYNGKVVATMSDHMVVITHGAEGKKEKIRQQNQFTEFWSLYVKHFLPKDSELSIRDPTGKGERVIGEGTYGALLPYYDISGKKDTSKLIKYITADKGVFRVNMKNHTENNYAWFVEFCSFIVIMAILIYIDCNLVIDSEKRTQCIKSRYQNTFNPDTVDNLVNVTDTTEHFLSYYSFMAKIDAPFVSETTAKDVYVLGYVVEAYDNTLFNMYSNIKSKQDFVDAFNLTYQIFEIMRKMTYLSNLGITISHRDITTKNIMYTKDPFNKNRFKIRLIDFGFLCSSIRFKDGNSAIVGYHPFEERDDLNKCNKRFLDIVLFIAWCLRYNNQIFSRLGISVKMEDIITLGNAYVHEYYDETNDEGDWVHSVWDYSAALDGIVEKLIRKGKADDSHRLDDKRVAKMYEDVFKVMNYAKANLDNNNVYTSTTGTEDTDYGKVSLFDIADIRDEGGLSKFYDMYEKNKAAYLDLTKNESGS